MKLLPTKKQWNKWSLPSKLTAISAYLAFGTVIISSMGMVLTKGEEFLSKKYSIESIKVDLEKLGPQLSIDAESAEFKSSVTYPQFSAVIDKDVFRRANAEILDSVNSYLTSNTQGIRYDYEVATKNSRIASLYLNIWYMDKRRWNQDGYYGSINIDIKNRTYIEFYDLFDVRKGSLDAIKDILRYKLCDDPIESDVFRERFISNSYIPKFAIGENEIIFLFSEYEVTPGVCGHLQVKVPISTLSDYLRKDGVLGEKASTSNTWKARNYLREWIQEFNKKNERK